ncbi:MAG: hypothetical protein FWD26_08020 [Treponema sp.]|nr:hypothetical protein [Treponema sp.]
MTNFKWGIIASIAAFVVSILLGIVSGVGVFHIIIRAFIFTAVFFGLGFGLRFVINSFFPELLFGGDSGNSEEQPGLEQPRVENTGEYAVPELYKTADNSELGNIEELISGVSPRVRSSSRSEGVDRNAETGYNNMVGIQDFPEALSFHEDSISEEKSAADKPHFTPSFGDDSGLGGLPDLDMMARAFSSGFSPTGFPVQSTPRFESTPFVAAAPIEDLEPAPRRGGNKPEPMKGDFKPKELAEGIRAVLSKEK